LLVLSVSFITSAVLSWLNTQAAEVRFLPAEGPAQWIIFQPSANVLAQRIGDRTALFTRSFELERAPESALLRARAFGRLAIRINGTPIELLPAPADNWKRPREVDVAAKLRQGTNQIAVNVTNDVGPPALWLVLTAGDSSIATDAQWQAALAGASPRNASLASEPLPIRSGNNVGGAERTFPSLWAHHRLLALFAVSAAAIWAIVWRLVRAVPRFRFLGDGVWQWCAVAIFAGFWLSLFVNNSSSLILSIGFDNDRHLEYTAYILKNKTLPTAAEGWEMHQPPLHYLISAFALGTSGLSATDPGAVQVLRFLNFSAAVAQFALAAACLRLVFPGQPLRQGAGLLLAAFLPMQMYMAHFETNDMLAGAVSTGAVYACLRVLQQPRPSGKALVVLGLLTGAAVLAKVTAVVLLPLFVIVLAGRLAAMRVTSGREWVRTMGLFVAACLAACGWHFGRVWAHFGTPFVGSFDPASGFAWWQDPGCSTTSYMLRFGRSLVEPFFSEFNGFPDGIYSTLWGDGLWGGQAEVRGRTPWNYELMAAGYLLALLPTAMIIVGIMAALIQVVRRPRPEWFLLLGLVVAMGLAMVYHFLKVPYACHVKAFYGLPAAISLSVLGGYGFGVLAERNRLVQAALWVVLGTWALTAYASFWVSSDASRTQAWLAFQFNTRKRSPALALEHFKQAVALDSDNVNARLGLATLLQTLGRPQEAQQQFEVLLARHPESPDVQYSLGLILSQAGKVDPALAHVKEAIRLAPDLAAGYGLLGFLYSQKGQLDHAILTYRHGIGVAPADYMLHYFLAMALASRGDTADAIRHYRYAIQWMPNWPPSLSALAMIRAAALDPHLRDGAEAIRLAGTACELTGFRDIDALDALAAAFAETGRFDLAQKYIQAALQLATASRQENLVKDLHSRLQLYEAAKPYRR
jgi:tetratricopeptide (TPR) repeat protein